MNYLDKVEGEWWRLLIDHWTAWTPARRLDWIKSKIRESVGLYDQELKFMLQEVIVTGWGDTKTNIAKSSHLVTTAIIRTKALADFDIKEE